MDRFSLMSNSQHSTRLISPWSPRFGRTLRWIASMALLAGTLAPGAAKAQRIAPATVTTMNEEMPDGSIRQIPIRRSGFDLFAAEDLAFGTLRLGGNLRAALAGQGGPVAQNQFDQAYSQRITSPQATFFPFFQMGFVAAAPPTEFRKIRSAYPGINNMSGSLGYTNLYWETLVSGSRDWGAADGFFGKTFSGVTAQAGSGCRADPNVYDVAGFSLLAQKDCPETWGSLGFDGKLVVPDSVWLNTFNANKATFRWDDWKLPRTRLNRTDYLGTQSTYAFISDYYREQRLRYGSVVRGGTGTPLETGYPLGLEIRVDSWQFSAPATRNTQFYQVQLVNRSAEVYGTGIDYDSLYFGTVPGFLFGDQAVSMYHDFSSNTAIVTRGNTSGNCTATAVYPRRYLNSNNAGCPSNTAGFTNGVWMMTWLKSPLGDVRNKAFSNPNSPYFNPSSPFADDTITYNHSHPGSVGRASQAMTRSTRAGFGYVASKEDDFLDGRNPSDFTIINYTGMLTPHEWNGSLPTTAANVKFPRFVPGATTGFGRWDYNNDGVQDTISVPSCGAQGCARTYSDTIPGGFRNEYGNILGTISAGPFKLRAGDTTQFLWAFSWAGDSISAKRTIDGVTESYRTNYAGPLPIAFPTVSASAPANGQPATVYTVASAELRDSVTQGSANSAVAARLTVRYPQINPVDPYMIGLVNKVRADSAAGDPATRRILRLNPTLLDSLRARANDNLSTVAVFKSCDGGTTFTTSEGAGLGTCVAAPTRAIDAAVPAFAWRPRTTVSYAGGIPSTATFVEDLPSGRTYNFVFVTRTRGFSDPHFTIVDSLPGRGLYVTHVQDAFGFPRDTINSAFATSGPASLTVYAPITNVAGRKYASVDTATARGNATQLLEVTDVQNDVSGTTRLVFANQFIVRKAVDTLTSATTTTIAARYVIPNAAVGPTGTVTSNFVAREQLFTAPVNTPVRNGANPLTGTFRSLAGPARIFIDTLNALPTYPGYVWATSDNRPIFAINTPFITGAGRAGNQQRDQASSPLYPGYTAVPFDTLSAATGFRQDLLANNVTRERNFVIRRPGDTLQANARQFLPQVSPVALFNGTGALANNKRVKGGQYELTWIADPWGPRAPFRLDPISDLQSAVTASLADVASKAATITDVSPRVAALVGATAARPLVRVRVPFTMKFTDPVGNRVEDVQFAMLARQTFAQGGVGNTRLLGTGSDTVRVSVPDSLWLPGDTLIVLQKVERDSSIVVSGTRVVIVQADGPGAFRPIPVLADSIGINRFIVACTGGANGTGIRPATDQVTCNPLAISTRGATTAGGYLPVDKDWKQVFDLTRTFDNRSVVEMRATPYTVATQVTKADLARISVVPNPYLARSDAEAVDGTRLAVPKITFTNVPEEGVLRVYSVAGQFLQELTWTKSDLVYAGNNATSGDLPYNLRTREGVDLSSGLYLYVLTATGSAGKNQIHRGKFVIIR